MGSLRPRSFTEIINVLWRRRKLFILMSLAMLLATLIVIRRIPNIYESSAQVSINLRNDPESMMEMNLFAKLQQELTSRETFGALIHRYNLYPKARDEEEAIGNLQKALKVETKMRNYSPEVPESVEIRFRHMEPDKAQAAVADLVNILEKGDEQRRSEASTEATLVASQISEVEDRLHQLAPERDLEELHLESLYRSDTGNSNQRREVENSIETLNDNAMALKLQAEEQRKEIAEHEKLINSLPATNGSPAYGALLAEKTKVEADIQSFSSQFTDKHPAMIQLRNQLAEINRQINHLESQPGASISMSLTPEGRDLMAMRRDLRRTESDLEVTQLRLQRRNQELGQLPRANEQSAPDRTPRLSGKNEMARAEYDTLVKRYDWLLERQDSLLKISSERNPSQTMFNVIDNANLPLFPAAPNRPALLAFALGLAMAFGVAITIVVETPRLFRINDSRDIEYFLGAPVLVAIPESLTSTERAHKRKLRITRAALLLALASAMAPVLVFLLSQLRVFQILAGK